MGILSDFVVADRSDASKIGATAERSAWPSLQSKGFTPLEVGLLHFALTGEDPDVPVSPPKFVRNPFTKAEHPVTVGTAYLDGFVCLEDFEESWVHEVPTSLVDELAAATDLPAIASKWAAFEELAGGDPEDLANIIAELQRLARLARTERKSLLLWTAL